MDPELRFDVTQLYRASGDFQRSGEELLDAHQQSQSASENAQHGWVGASHGALTGMLEQWSTVTGAHTNRFVGHVDSLNDSAGTFCEMTKSHVDAVAAVYPKGTSTPRDL